VKQPKNPSKLLSDRRIFIGGGLMAIGMLMSLVALSPLVTGRQLSSLWWWLAMVTGIGFIVLLSGVRKAAKRRSKLVQAHMQGEK
jgi:hypothetical protein